MGGSGPEIYTTLVEQAPRPHNTLGKQPSIEIRAGALQHLYEAGQPCLSLLPLGR